MDLRNALESEKVSGVGYRELTSIQKSATVGEAVRLMQEKRVGCILVLEGEALAGIFTERDLLTRVLGTNAPLTEPLAKYVTESPSVARTDAPLHAVLTRMYQGRLRHLPVVDGSGAPVGTMSIKRAVHFLTEQLPQPILNIPPEPDVFPATREGG